MMYKAFFDTNILAYEFDTKEYKKQNEGYRINREYVENYSFWKNIKYILLAIKAIFKS